MKNILIEYQGGGYDGCVWEWNYCLVDKNGKFFNIHSSGYAGIDHKEQLKTRLTNTTDKVGKDFSIYNFSNPADLAEFAKESNVHGVLGCAQWVDKHDPDISDNLIPLTCSCCGEDKDSDDVEFTPDDYQGDGGIGIQFNSLLCHECNSIHSCGYCGDYYGPEYEHFNDDGYCEYCAEKEAQEKAVREADKKKTDYDKWVKNYNLNCLTE